MPRKRKTKTKRKKKITKSELKRRLYITAGCVVGAALIVMLILDALGVYTFRQLKIDLGMIDAPAENADLSVHFIDVGQGDATLVLSDGHAMLVDCGESDKTNTMINYLNEQGIEKLDYIICTHPHSDHMGEMSDVVNAFDFDNFIMPKLPKDQTPTNSLYEKMLTAIRNKNKKITAAENTEFSLGKAKVQLFVPKEDYSSLNNYSVIVKIIHEDNSFLITGDCETEEEKEMLEKGYDLSAKVLKAAHHGSKTSSSSDFLDEVLPRYAVISCGADNRYGHPHEPTVNRLKKYADNIYVTTKNGDIVFLSDGKGLTVVCEKESN